MHHTAKSESSLLRAVAHLTGEEPAPRQAAAIPRVLPDAAWLLRGNPDHPEHDAWGLRNAGGALNPELIVIGGDQVYGAGVGPDQCWPALLQKRLGCGVLNAGMPGWGSVQFALAAEQLSELAPRRMVVCLTPASDLVQAFYCAGLSNSPLARSFHEDRWDTVAQPDPAAMNLAGRAIAELSARHPDLAQEDVLSLLAQRGQPDVDPCVIEASRFYLAEHSLFAMQNLEHPAIDAGLSVTVKVLEHLRNISEERDFSLSILLLPSREYLVYQRVEEARLGDRDALERLGMAEALVLGELRASCAGMGLRCFDLTSYLKHFVGSRIHAQNSRQGQLTAKGCELMARFVRERVLPGAVKRLPLRTAVGGSYPL